MSKFNKWMILHHLYLPEALWLTKSGHATSIFSTMAARNGFSLWTAVDCAAFETLSMDDPANMPTLQDIGARAAKQQVRGEDFPSNFDLAVT